MSFGLTDLIKREGHDLHFSAASRLSRRRAAGILPLSNSLDVPQGAVAPVPSMRLHPMHLGNRGRHEAAQLTLSTSLNKLTLHQRQLTLLGR